jgi:hypothetical protein
MSQPEWVEPHLAAHWLAHHWDIPLQTAEQIVRGVLRSNEAAVRGRGRGLAKGIGFGDTGLRLIGREIGATLNPGSLISWEFSDVEIDWNCLLKHGRNLVPPEHEYWVSAAIEKSEGHPPEDREPKMTKREAIAIFIEEKYPGGLPGGITYQEIARDFERNHKVRVHPRTVSRALGHK